MKESSEIARRPRFANGNTQLIDVIRSKRTASGLGALRAGHISDPPDQ